MWVRCGPTPQPASGDQSDAFVIQRMDCDALSACAELDPAYAKELTEAAENGVEVLA